MKTSTIKNAAFLSTALAAALALGAAPAIAGDGHSHSHGHGHSHGAEKTAKKDHGHSHDHDHDHDHDHGDGTRELGAHEHGKAVLTMAVEGSSVAMELELSAIDVIGFETKPETAEETAAVEAALAQLSTPADLFDFGAAGCAPAEAAAERKQLTKGHAEFIATYSMNCASIDQMAALGLPIFSVYPQLEEVDVQIVSETGQQAFEVEREEPQVDLSGSI
ncbi:MAG: DUF2796 domain-containing protein [Pseudomonadota bacterium]